VGRELETGSAKRENDCKEVLRVNKDIKRIYLETKEEKEGGGEELMACFLYR
jgi:hypothetical protein